MYSTKMAGIAGFVVKSLRQNPGSHADSNRILSVLVPVHNEGDQIAENLSLIHAEASKTGLPMEMITRSMTVQPTRHGLFCREWLNTFQG